MLRMVILTDAVRGDMSKFNFSKINKSSAKSFNKQRNLIKKIGQGQTVPCAICASPLKLTLSAAEEAAVSCENGCIEISLQLEI